MRRILIVFACATLFLPAALHSQQVTIEPRTKPRTPKQGTSGSRADTEPSPKLRVDTSLVQVPVTVTDRLGRTVSGLEQENFRVFDNNEPQSIVKFAMDDEPVAIGFVFDISGSIGSRLQQYRLAAREFFKNADVDDEFFLVEFQSTPQLVVALTKNAAEIDYQIMMTQSKGQTALFDAVHLAANEIKKSKLNKKAMILVSDGGENHSRYNLSEVQNALRETDSLLYSVGPAPYNTYGENNGRLLKHLAEMTGGRLIEEGDRDLSDLARKIIVDLRNRYVLYYSPTDKSRDGRHHHIAIRLVPPKGLPTLTPHWRAGYDAPINQSRTSSLISCWRRE